MKKIFNKANFASIVVCCLISFTLVKVIESKIEWSASTEKEVGKVDTRNSTRVSKEVRKSSQEQEGTSSALVDSSSYDFLLIESILSIIQNYYVDEDRVSNRHMMMLALESLAKRGEIEYRQSGDAIILHHPGKDLVLDLSGDFDLTKFVEMSARVAELIKDSDDKKLQSTKWLNAGRFKFLDRMLGALDPHSSLLDTFAYKELRQGTEGAFGGLGVVVGVKNNLLTVIKPIPRSPAERAGISKDDQILEINSKSTFGATLESLVEFMRGAPGTDVNISLMKEGAYSPERLTVKREIIQVDSVASRLIDFEEKKILHLAIESFSARTSREVQSIITKAELEHRLSGIVLDLRSNPGGLLDQAVQVSDLFLKSGTIVTTKGRREEVENAGMGYSDFDHPLMVLINNDSASASEIVAGALQDNSRAVIIGQPSFGKGSVQTIFELPGDQALKLTIARYYTPSGTSIQNRGIIPDVWLQPVLLRKHNRNLLGAGRYRSERFLLNSLKNEDKYLTQSSRYLQNKYLGYYLADELVESPIDSDLVKDRELAVACRMLAQGQTRSKNLRRDRGDNHQLISTLINQSNRNLSNWLLDRFDIDWTKDFDQPIDRNLIEIELAPDGKVVKGENSDLELAWKISNLNSVPLERLSLFVQLGDSSFESFEFLIGKVMGKDSKSGVIHIPFRLISGEDHIQFKYGLSTQGIPLVFNDKPNVVQVGEGPIPEIAATFDLIDNREGGIAGALEPNERAYLKISVVNNGKRTARDLQLDLYNLAGQQISIEKLHDHLPELEVGNRWDVFFPVRAAQKIVNEVVDFGVTVTGANLVRTFKKRGRIKGIANVPLGKSSSNLLGH